MVANKDSIIHMYYCSLSWIINTSLSRGGRLMDTFRPSPLCRCLVVSYSSYSIQRAMCLAGISDNRSDLLLSLNQVCYIGIRALIAYSVSE